MSAIQKVGGWVKGNYEMLILLVVLVLLVASAAFLVIQTEGENSKLSDTKSLLDRRGEPAELLVVEPYSNLVAELRRNIPEPEYENRMFVSGKRVACVECGKPIPYYALTCPFCNAKQPEIDPGVNEDQDSDIDGMPDRYEDQMGFKKNDPDDAEMDADLDGFTNIEEYKAETDPNDKDSTPDLATKIRLVDVRRNEFQLRFNSVQQLPGNVRKFQLNLRTLERTYFPQLGDVINDKKNGVIGVKVLEYLPDAAEGPTLIVEKDGDKIRLVKNKKVTQYDLTARIAFLIDRKMYMLKIQESFNIRGKEFKVVDISPESVLLLDVSSGEEKRIPKITRSEISRIRGRSSGEKETALPGFLQRGEAVREYFAPAPVDRGRVR